MKAIETALSLTQAYKLGIERFEKMLGNEFAKAVESMNNSSTHIIVCGMGKSGLVGRKISSTLASTGTPSIFLHPVEALHGDLGKVYPKEVEVNLSIIILHYYPLVFGGGRRQVETIKWAQNRNRDWPHGTGPTYPVLEYMTEDEQELPELVVTPEDPEVEQVEPEVQTTTRAPGEEPIQWVVDEYGNIQVLNY